MGELITRAPDSRDALRSAALCALRHRIALAEELRARDLLPEDVLLEAMSQLSHLPVAGAAQLTICPHLLAELGAGACLQALVLPLGRRGDQVFLAIAHPALRARLVLMPALQGLHLNIYLASPGQIRQTIADAVAPDLLEEAENRLPPAMSVRGLRLSPGRLARVTLVMAALALLLLAPGALVLALTFWLVIALLASTVLRAVALHFAMSGRHRLPAPVPKLPAAPPVITVLVPLYGEPDIAPRLVQRLKALDYPRGCLEVLLVLEEKDPSTLAALQAAGLPGWMQLVVVPAGSVTTKPRAMNYALSFARGSIIGIYDAEDAPDPDQLIQVAARFADAPADLACLQGALDYYNPRSNLIARLFTAEYAAWFRVMMPALQRLRFPMPLGGTTLFIRRDYLEQVGAWDSHNVTEDADLGIRLARAGLRTEMLPVTTHEEANCRLRPWLRQRSRWIKGHLLTWAVHMRHPRQLWRDLGPAGFLGYQIVFLGAQSQVLLAPLNWSFWLLLIGLPHPARQVLGEGPLLALTAVFLLSELLLIACATLALTRTRHRGLWKVTVMFQMYHLLAACAGWKALAEAFRNPFYWAKTSHGHYESDLQSPARPLLAPVAEALPAAARIQATLARTGVPAAPEGHRVPLFRRVSAEIDLQAEVATTAEGPGSVRTSPASIFSRVSNASEM